MLLGKESIWANTATLVPFEKQKSKRQRKIDNSMVVMSQKTETFYKNNVQYWQKSRPYSSNTL